MLVARLAQLEQCGSILHRKTKESCKILDNKKEITWKGMAFQIDSVQRDLCLAISDQLDIDELEVLVLLRTYLESEHHSIGMLEHKKSLKSDGFDEFLDAFYVFFFEEQLAVIRCVSALLRIAEDAHNELFDIATSVLDKFADTKLAQRCLKWFEEETSKPLPSNVASDTHYAMLWVRQGLERQLALLEVAFLLYYGRVPPCAAFTADVLECAHRTQFGQRQANASIFDSDAYEKCQCIRDLLVFLAVECLNLEAALDVVPEGVSASEDPALAPFASDIDALNRSIAQLEMAASNVAYSPLLLGFALVLRRLEEAGTHSTLDPRLAAAVDVMDNGPPIWRRLVQGAFDPSMELYGMLRALVSSPLLGTGTRTLGASNLSALAYRAVFKGLLLTITDLVHPEYFTDIDTLVDLWCCTFRAKADDVPDGIAALCTQFWTQDIQYPTRASLLSLARRRFPASFRPLVLLMQALSGTMPGSSSPETAMAVIDFLAHVSSVALTLPKIAASLAPWQTIDELEAPSVTYQLRSDMQISSTRVILPAGTRGVLVSPPGEVPAIVLWQPVEPISAWHILHDALLARVSTPSRRLDAFEGGDGPWSLSPDWSNCTASLDIEVAGLFTDVLQAEDSIGETLLSHLGEHEGLVSAALGLVRAALTSSPLGVRRLCHGYRLLMALLPHRSNEIWQWIRSTNILIGSPGIVPLSDVESPHSALLAHEKNTGTFTGTLCLLDLLYALLEQTQSSQFIDPPQLVQVKASVLARSFAWVATDIWNDHRNWTYNDNSTWMQISLKCMRLFSAVLGDPCLNPLKEPDTSLHMDAVRPLHEVVERVLGEGATSLTLAPMLVALGTGHARIDALYRSGHAFAARLLERLVETCLSTTSMLVTRSQRSHLLTTLFVSAAPDARGTLASVILAYIPAAVPPSLATAAAHLVTDIVRAPDVAALRLAGHLGSTNQVEDVVGLLLDVLENSFADTSLRVALWQMFSAFVSSQPALATLLLTGAHLAHDHAYKPSDSSALKRTALQLAVDSLVLTEDLWTVCPELLDAVLGFMTEAWEHAVAHPIVFGALRKQPEFWDRLDRIICKKVPVPLLDPSDLLFEHVQNEEATQYAFQLECQARALRIMELDLCTLKMPRQSSDSSCCIRVLEALCNDENRFIEILHHAMQTMPMAVPRSVEQHAGSLARDIPWPILRHAPRRDDYDRQRIYGPYYIYHLPSVLLRSQTTTSADVEELASCVGLTWSIVDAQAKRARAWTDCLGGVMAHLLAQAEAQGSAKYEALQRSLSRTVTHIGPLALAEDRSHVVLLLAVLVGASYMNLNKESLSQLCPLVAQLCEYPAYKLPSFASQSVRTPLVQLMLTVSSACHRQNVSEPALSSILSYAMEALVQLDSLIPFLDAPVDEAARAAEADLDVLIAFLRTCMTTETSVPKSTWLTPMRETCIIPAAASILRCAPLTPEHNGAGAPRTHIRFFMPVLRLIEALSAQPVACELVVQAGVVRALCTTALSALLEQGALDPVLPSGDPHPLHATWLLMLRTVVRLVENLGLESRAYLVDADVQAFVNMYALQIRRSFLFSPLTQPSPVEIGQLHEVCMILRLFRSMWMAKAQGAISSDSPMSRARRMPLGEYFLQDIPLLLQQIAYVYNHPKELLTMLGLTNHAGAPTESLSKFAQQTVKEALALLLGLLWDISGADAILTFDKEDWPMLPAVIQPSMHVAPHAPASFGTLLQLASGLTEDTKHDQDVCGLLEQCVGLCVTQAMVWDQGPVPIYANECVQVGRDQARAELEAGLGRDIDAAIQTASNAIRNPWWDVLRAFHERCTRPRSSYK